MNLTFMMTFSKFLSIDTQVRDGKGIYNIIYFLALTPEF